MKKQEIFDKVAAHLLTQGRKSFKNGRCAYRGDGGLACSAGCLIPDKMYDPEMEGLGVTSLFRCYPAVKKLIGKNNKDLLYDLLRIHDHWESTNWEERLFYVSTRENLSPKVLERF